MIFYIPIAILALGGVAMFPNLDVADAVIPTVLFEFAPVWLASIIVAGAVAAAMSTADSQLHAVSTLVARDWYENLASDPDDDTARLVAKGSVAVLGIISYIVAIQEISFIVELANIAFEGAAQIFPLVVGAFFWRSATREGAIAGFSLGVIVTALLTFGFVTIPKGLPGFLPGFYGLLINVTTFIGLSLVVDAVPDENRSKIQGYINRATSQQRKQSRKSDD